jgi:hypothetical protein
MVLTYYYYYYYYWLFSVYVNSGIIQGVPLPTKPGSSLIIPKSIKILQRDLNSGAFVGGKWKRNMSAVRAWLLCNILISGKIIKELPGLVGSGTSYISK